MMLGNKSDLASERKVHFFRAQEVAARLGIEPFEVTQASSCGQPLTAASAVLKSELWQVSCTDDGTAQLLEVHADALVHCSVLDGCALLT